MLTTNLRESLQAYKSKNSCQGNTLKTSITLSRQTENKKGLVY